MSTRELDAYLASEGDPLRIFAILRMSVAPCTWLFTLRIGDHQEPVLEFRAPDPTQRWLFPSDLVSGIVPEVLWCRRLEIVTGSERIVLRGARNRGSWGSHDSSIAGTVEESTLPPVIRLHGYCGERIPPSLTSYARVRAALADQTWFGSMKYRSNPQTLSWRVMADEKLLTPSGGSKFLNGLNTFVGTSGGGIRLATGDDAQGFAFRDTWTGWFGDTPLFQPLEDGLRAAGLRGGIVEFDGWPPTLCVLHRVMVNASLIDALPNLVRRISASQDIRQYCRARHEREVIRATARLNERILAARQGRQVRLNSEPLCLAPTSEMGAVGLFHILEGRNALPFALFRSRAWSGHEGIDVIADVQIRDTDHLAAGVPVEFEFTFDNFIRHGHPHEHVRLVVCWGLGTRHHGKLHPTSKPWLYEYVNRAERLPVVVMKEFPGITID